MSRTTRHSRLRTAWLAALLTLIVAAVACERGAGTTVEEVQEEPAEYYGEEVTVTGEVTNLYSPRAFTLEAGGLVDDTVLVLTKTPIQVLAPATMNVGDNIAVTGVVQRLVIADIERDIGWDLDMEIETEYQGKPVIVAQDMVFLREQGRWREGTGYEAVEGAGAMGRVPTGMEEMRGGVEQIAVIIAMVAPEAHAGQQVTLEHVPVRKVAGDKAFWVGGEQRAQQLMVVVAKPPEGKVDVNEGQTVTIRGTLQQMPAPPRAARQWGLHQHAKGAVKEGTLYLKAESVETKAS